MVAVEHPVGQVSTILTGDDGDGCLTALRTTAFDVWAARDRAVGDASVLVGGAAY
jgi:hypothetical protein